MHAVEQQIVVGEHPGFEVATAISLRTQAGAGEVRRAEVELGTVDGDHLQVYPRAPPHLEAALPTRIVPPELCEEWTRWGGSVQEPDIDASVCQLHEQLDDRGVDHEYAEFDGEHNWDSWSRRIEHSLQFFDRHLEATQ